MGIQVNIYKKDGKSLEAEIKRYVTELSEKHTHRLAEETKKKMHEVIDDTRVRPEKTTGNRLKDSIDAEKIDGGYGVGNQDTLNTKTPWWIWINYGRALSGREIPPGTQEDSDIRGEYIPQQRGLFQKGFYPMNPTKPITAHNYIEKTLAYIFGIIKNTGILK